MLCLAAFVPLLFTVPNCGYVGLVKEAVEDPKFSQFKKRSMNVPAQESDAELGFLINDYDRLTLCTFKLINATIID